MISATRTAPDVPRGRHRLVAGRYLLLDQIGAGGMGSVWRARDQRTGGLVAVKVLGQHSGALLARFMREQAIRLRHPHVVAPTGWAAEDDVVLLVMELVTGGSVQTLLDQHRALPEPVVATVLEQVLRALAAVHGAGVVHRDVKPANLLLEPTADGTLLVRLADFGIAVDLTGERLTTSPAAIGTDGYMAPDQVRGDAPDPRQDLYAVGVLGLHLLTGVRPHAAPGTGPPGSTGAVLAPVPSCRLRPLLDRLLADAPDHRPASAEEALALLRRLAVPAYDGPPLVHDRLGPAPDARPRWTVPLRGRPAPGTVLAAASLPLTWGVTGACGVVLTRLLGS